MELDKRIVLLRRPLPPVEQKNHKTKHVPRETREKSSGNILASPLSGIRPTTRKSDYCEEIGDVTTVQPYVVQPRKPRGPEKFPARMSARTTLPNTGLAVVLAHHPSPRPTPLFTLNDFQELAQLTSYQWRSLGGQRAPRAAVISRQNYEKLTSWFATHVQLQTEVHSQMLEGEPPEVVIRKPRHQVLLGERVFNFIFCKIPMLASAVISF
jgi:hypothetical protein